MIISRKEFHRRIDLDIMSVEKEETIQFDVNKLYEECKRDAPFRNHEYMFTGKDFSHLPLQEDTVGIKNIRPDIKTEGERLAMIKMEMENMIHRPVPVFFDIDYPSVFYINDGFHRIFLAKQMSWKTIQVHAKHGKFNLKKNLPMIDLAPLLEMVDGLFGKDFKTIKEIITFLNTKANKEKMEITSICYGRDGE